MRDMTGLMRHHRTTAPNFSFSPQKPEARGRIRTAPVRRDRRERSARERVILWTSMRLLEWITARIRRRSWINVRLRDGDHRPRPGLLARKAKPRCERI